MEFKGQLSSKSSPVEWLSAQTPTVSKEFFLCVEGFGVGRCHPTLEPSEPPGRMRGSPCVSVVRQLTARPPGQSRLQNEVERRLTTSLPTLFDLRSRKPKQKDLAEVAQLVRTEPSPIPRLLAPASVLFI